MNEPCDFVKLVLSRMDSNPDEFEHYGRWNSLCESLERYAGAYTGNRPVPDRQVLWAYDQFEIDLMVAKYREIYRAREYKSMLKSLLVGVEPKEGYLIRDAKNMASSTKGLGSGDYADSQRYANVIGQAVLGSGQQYAANTTTSMGLNPQLRAQMDDMIEAKMRRLDRG
jgi:hypothetical protein